MEGGTDLQQNGPENIGVILFALFGDPVRERQQHIFWFLSGLSAQPVSVCIAKRTAPSEMTSGLACEDPRQHTWLETVAWLRCTHLPRLHVSNQRRAGRSPLVCFTLVAQSALQLANVAAVVGYFSLWAVLSPCHHHFPA